MYIDDFIEKHFRLSDYQKSALKKLRLVTIADLLYHFPSRYDTPGERSATVAGVTSNDKVVLYGTLSKLKAKKSWRTKRPMAEGVFTDDTGTMKVVWFNQPYLAKMVQEGTPVKVSGKVSERNGEFSLLNPEVEQVSSLPIGGDEELFENGDTPTLFPVYPESRGVTSRWMYHALKRVFKAGVIEKMTDPIPADILKKYNLPALSSALVWIHTPQHERDARAARKRFAFEEVFLIQLKKQQERRAYEAEPSWIIDPPKEHTKQFVKRFPFSPTAAQSRAARDILADFKSPHAMGRLLEGDVGSGKTFVAAVTAHAAVTTRPVGADGARQDFGNLQVAYMAPTEILATQLFESFIEFFSDLPIHIALITGSGCRKFPSKVTPNTWTDISRTQLLKWVANGEIPILIGTHALIQKTVKFKHLAYVIIDEQHRFGTNQRSTLVRGKTRRTTRTNADEDKNRLLYEKLTYEIRGAAFNIRNALGSGHKEQVYQNAFAQELQKRGIGFDKEKRLSVLYNNKQVGHYQPDFIIEDSVLVELKALPNTSAKEKRQLWDYLRGTKYKLALLINFGTPQLDIHRVIYDSARGTHRRQSASHLHASAQEVRLPHLLSMTATPIPRTLALTIYGDLDLTLLDEMPPGRKRVITEVVKPEERERVYEHIRTELSGGRQVYVITPRIDEPDPEKFGAIQAKSVKEEAKHLQKEVFTDHTIGVLHGKLTPKEKDRVMKAFAAREIDVLAATSVVEVGVNVPNATTIIIEGAERFGLAQLHQLRGRVLRSTHQAYCYLFTESKGKTTLARLKALAEAKNGFELAERDLELRGSGDLYGRKQWGISDVGMEAIKNIKMVEAARAEARALIEEDPELTKHRALGDAVASRGEIHFE